MVERGCDSRIPDDDVALPVIVTDASGVVRLFNVGAERMLGYTAAEIVDRIVLADILDPQDLGRRARAVGIELASPITPNCEALICRAAFGVEDRYETTLIDRNSTRVPVAVSVTALCDEGGCAIGYRFILSSLAEVDYVNSDLLVLMSHEMRTPLSAILGFAQLMEIGTPSPTLSQKQRIDRILEAGWHLEELISVTRDIALVESGSLSLALTPVSLAEVMLECRALTEPKARMHGVRLRFPRFETPCMVSADRTRLQQVLSTVILAIIEHGTVGGSVVVDCAALDSERIHIAFREDGKTSSTEQAARPAAANGTQMGLRLARSLVGMMGGRIGAETMVGARKVFSLDLKRVLVSPETDRYLTLPTGGFPKPVAEYAATEHTT